MHVIDSLASALASSLLDPKHLIEVGGLVVVTAIIFAESCLIFFLPGDSLLFTAGIFAYRGDVNLVLLIVCTLLAAVIGNAFAYWLGATAGSRLFKPGSRIFKPDHLDKATEFYEEHGSKTIVIARFVPIVRTFAPIVAGASRMQYRKFVVFNVLGALMWTVGISLLGYFAANAIGDDIDRYLLPLVAAIVVASLVPAAWHWRRERRARGGAAPGSVAVEAAEEIDVAGH